MRILALGALLAVAVAGSAEEIDVKATPAGRLSLKVTASPLSEVLDRLARQTGMKVIYDGAPPRTVVRFRQVEDVTPADAVANVLEGLGVSYALRLDSTGAKVDTLLVIAATKAAGSASSRPNPPSPRLPGLASVPLPVDDDAEDEPSERSEDAMNAIRDAAERPEIVRPPTGALPGMPVPAPGQMGIPGVTAPVMPTGPVAPLMLQPPGTTPPPSPPPQ
jgi:hypothetical protein